MNNNVLGERIRKMRKSRHLSQVELASAIGVSKQSISNWENNNILPSVEVTIKLANFFHCPTDYLFGLDDHTSTYTDANLTPDQSDIVATIIKTFEELNQSRKN